MQTKSEAANLNDLLKELHAKKKWLDTVIEALESAVRSPDCQLVQSILGAYSNGYARRPKVDLRPRQKARISRLASRVSSRANGHEKAMP